MVEGTFGGIIVATDFQGESTWYMSPCTLEKGVWDKNESQSTAMYIRRLGCRGHKYHTDWQWSAWTRLSGTSRCSLFASLGRAQRYFRDADKRTLSVTRGVLIGALFWKPG